jgi:hypothetical protein
VELVVNGKGSGEVEIPVARAHPGIFTVSQTGTGPALARNEDGTLNSAGRPARLGSVITLYATGVPDTREELQVFLYWREATEAIRLERLPDGVVAIQARLPGLPDPGFKGVQICVSGSCSRPIDEAPRFWWQRMAPRGVSLYLASPSQP